MEEIKTGDVVKLKSGGPEMTVTWIDTSGTETKASVAWFGVDGKVDHNQFPLKALDKIS